MTSLTLQQIRRERDAGRVREAARQLIQAAAAGDVDAIVELAQWRIAGATLRRDLQAARDLLRRAAAAGDRAAAFLHANFLAAGVGGSDDWAGAVAALGSLRGAEPRAAAQLGLLDAMDLDPGGFPNVIPVGEPISDAPFVAACRNFLSAAECDYLRARGEPTLQPSVVIDPATGKSIPHPIRTSDGTMFGVHDEDPVINALNRRIAALSGTRPEQGEPLQLLRYGVGGEYRAHMDGITAEPNQRVLTVLVYLSEDYDGGETCFPRTGLRFRGRKGDALLFRNTGADEQPDPLSLHAGLPVTRGTKLLATRWIRKSRFVYPPPQPLLPEFG